MPQPPDPGTPGTAAAPEGADLARALREREQQMTALMEAALEAIIAVDVQQRIVLFNRAAARMFGVPPQEALGSGLERFLPQRYRAAHRLHVAMFATEGITSRRMGWAREVTGLRSNGEEFPMEASISRIGHGSTMLLAMTARDVSRLRQAEVAQLARMAAEAASRAKTELLARVSHDLRTPLNAVLGFAQLMQADPAEPLGARQQERLAQMLLAGDRLRGLIDELLGSGAGDAAHGAGPAPARPPQAPPCGQVLYVEDNPVNALLVEQLLARWPDVRLVVAGDGTGGLRQARELRPDVLLLDMQLPDMDGIQVLQRLKADAATRDIPVVVLSTDAVLEDMQAARDAGALDYWTKPVDFDRFIAGMAGLLGGAAPER
jgi:PAS domain S-box-containing protein